MRKKKPFEVTFGEGKIAVGAEGTTLTFSRLKEPMKIGADCEGDDVLFRWHFKEPASLFVVIKFLSQIGLNGFGVK